MRDTYQNGSVAGFGCRFECVARFSRRSQHGWRAGTGRGLLTLHHLLRTVHYRDAARFMGYGYHDLHVGGAVRHLGISILPSAGKAIFKELFKLIFRQRRKYFRAKAAGGDLRGFSFRLAFILQVLVVVLLTLAQGPIFYIWAWRSCLFLKQFIYYGVLAAITRMSLMGLVQDFVWYLIIKTWGWKDLCPYCTERIKHCDCFNDEVLVLAVEHVGPKWELIQILDGLLAKHTPTLSDVCGVDAKLGSREDSQL
ncbi:hypothetical protein PHYPSEUDO_010803 [Phytophthora pseudosyringae]|uniref:Transmembrane protein n=1 Tax=Phytophthora pseudosyringae TaxID=221518 RepID=A0A8T1W7B4_9STRA|nr:hypothetical protein PHYPSEUDO_010803 [Phytophthora pseudosyringae]